MKCKTCEMFGICTLECKTDGFEMNENQWKSACDELRRARRASFVCNGEYLAIQNLVSHDILIFHRLTKRLVLQAKCIKLQTKKEMFNMIRAYKRVLDLKVRESERGRME